eukprot:s2494_g1.t2
MTRWSLLVLATLVQAVERCGDASNLCYAWSLEGRCDDGDFYKKSCPFSCGICTPHSCSAANASEAFCSVEDDAEHAVPRTEFASGFGAGPKVTSSKLRVVTEHDDDGGGGTDADDDGDGGDDDDDADDDGYFIHPDPDEEHTHVGRLAHGEAVSLQTYPDHVFQLRDPGPAVIGFDKDYLDAVAGCVDTPPSSWDGDCREEASAGGCVANPGWMTLGHMNMSQEPALRPGDMDEMFADLSVRAAEYNLTILSRSPWTPGKQRFSDDGCPEPPVLTLESRNTRSEDNRAEIDGLLSVTSEFARSSDQGEKSEFGVGKGVISKHRTSQTAWCEEECKATSVFHKIRDRISHLIVVPWKNFETMQKYQVGEAYARHHDMHNVTDNEFTPGPRIYTFFLYLSDVEEGGETEFTELNISVSPRKGSALLWPSVLSQNPTVQDQRTLHAAKPVIRGTKVAANVWVHLFDFEEDLIIIVASLAYLSGIQLDVLAFNAAIAACSRSTQWRQALSLLHELQSSPTLAPDAASFSGAGSSLVRAALWEQALALPVPRLNVVSFGTLLAACEKGARWEEIACPHTEAMLLHLLCHVVVFSALGGEIAREAYGQDICDTTTLLQVHQKQNQLMMMDAGLDAAAGCPAVPDIKCRQQHGHKERGPDRRMKIMFNKMPSKRITPVKCSVCQNAHAHGYLYSVERYDGLGQRAAHLIMCLATARKYNLNFGGLLPNPVRSVHGVDMRKYLGALVGTDYNHILRRVRHAEFDTCVYGSNQLRRKGSTRGRNVLYHQCNFGRDIVNFLTPGFLNDLRRHSALLKGDISARTKQRGRDKPDKVYLQLITIVTKMLKDADVHVFSTTKEGNYRSKDFDIYRSRGYKVHLDRNEMDDWKHMAQADVLIQAPSGFSWVAGVLNRNCVVAYSSYSGQMLQALQLLQQMRRLQIEATSIAMNSAISACGRGEQWESALQLYAELVEGGADAGNRTQSALMTSLARGVQWTQAIHMLQHMSTPNIVVHTAACEACARAGRWQEVLCLFRDLLADKLKPDLAAFHVTLSACAAGGQWLLALELLHERLPQAQLQPTPSCFALATQACEQQA